jgi:hydroxymethylpyrimidine pyrophosphatase-like HAD family hydrolase
MGVDPIVGFLDGHRAERLADPGGPFSVPLAVGETFRYVDGLDRLVDDRPIRVFLPTGPERHRSVRRAAANRFAGQGSVIWSDLSGIEILAPGTHKGEAVAWLAAGRGIDLAEVAAVGDGANDVEMLWGAGRSAAMGNAPFEAKVVADIVVLPAADGGLLDALAWFFPDLWPGLVPRTGQPHLTPATR